MKYATNTVILRDVSTFHGAEYNPRKMIPERLKQVMVSLAKLGFVLPIYVNKNGTILSGHQRTTAAMAYGYTKVPVVEIDVPDSAEKGVNLFFNKGTNDLDTYAANAKNAFLEYVEKAEGLNSALPDIPPDSAYPCMTTKRMSVKKLVEMAGVDVSTNLRVNGGALIKTHAYMPIVVCGDRVINGKGRIFGYLQSDFDECDVVEVEPEKADYAYLALNYLAMDFDIQSHFQDELRFNAFRRKSVQNQIVGLSRTYPYFVYGRVISNTVQKYAMLEGQTNPDLALLPTANEDSRKKFQDTYGKTILDMGAGTLHDARLMQQAGFDCIPFEPYYAPPDCTEVSPDASRQLIAQFLDRVEGFNGGQPDSIISSFVLNSIPHHRDRMAYLVILGALARLKTPVYIGTQSTKTLMSENLSAHLRLNSSEPNMTLGNDSRFFKAQKFYMPEELERMLSIVFAKVQIKAVEGHVFAQCSHPRRPSPGLLREALELEFNLPYKDGSRMNLHERAISVFAKHTGVRL